MFGGNKKHGQEQQEQVAYTVDAQDPRLDPDWGKTLIHRISPEDQIDGKEFQVFYFDPEKQGYDEYRLSHAEMVRWQGLDEHELAEEAGYRMPAEYARIRQLADGKAGLASGSSRSISTEPTKMSFDKLLIEGFKFEGNLGDLLGTNHPEPQVDPVQQAMIAMVLGRTVAQAGGMAEQGMTDLGEMRAQHFDDHDPYDDVIDVNTIDDVEEEPQPDVPEMHMPAQPEVPTTPVELKTDDNEANAGAQVQTPEEQRAKRAKMLHHIGTGAVSATILTGTYGVLSWVLGLNNHWIWKADPIGNTATVVQLFTGHK